MRLIYCDHIKLQAFDEIARQDPNEDLGPETIAAIADNLSEAKSEITSFRTEEKALKTKLSALLGTQTTSELQESIVAREAELAELRLRLEPLRSGTVAPVNVKVKEKVDKELLHWEAAARRRKKIRDEMWALIEDALPEEINAEELKVC